MTKTTLRTASLLLVLAGLIVWSPAFAAPKPQVYEGLITQVNQADGSFVLRLRDGSLIAVPNPFQAGVFLNIKGTFANNALSPVAEIKIKDAQGADAIPAISITDPGSGEVGTKITITGSGFTKKNNSVRIGAVQNAVIGLASKDGKTLTFNFPPAPCDQKTNKKNCPQKVVDPGIYNIAVSNANGVSNETPFQVLPLPRLGITTEILPQAVSDKYYRFDIEGIGGAESYVWRIISGTVPSGMRFAQAACKESPCKSDATISGVPRVPGTYEFTVDLVSGGEEISRSYHLTIVQSLSE